MGCSNCGTGSCGVGEAPQGCGNKGHCSSGSCNKLNAFDWLAGISLPDQTHLDIVEVSFKEGARKEFFRKPHYLQVQTGDYITVESPSGGYDIGRVALSGELVRLQLKKKKVKEDSLLPMVLRLANERDLERMEEARGLERDTMIQARIIARALSLQMKIGDVEYQGDKRKVTFYYTADGRIDFRELIRIYAKEFKVKIEMRQIGARQESARIGGIGACGRELCCSTWLSDFKSVSTLAARYQNLAINQSKLSGQCGRLKCCLNYELNTYLDAIKHLPRQVERLQTLKGEAFLIKTDIFKRLMYFSYRHQGGGMEVQALPAERVKIIAEMNRKGEKPEDLLDDDTRSEMQRRSNRAGSSLAQGDQVQFVDGSGSIELPPEQRRKRRKRKPNEQRPPLKNNNEERPSPPPRENRNNNNENNPTQANPSRKRPRRRPPNTKTPPPPPNPN